jgi:ABC-type glycerol-3-phosphate transport system substrate-binding protein
MKLRQSSLTVALAVLLVALALSGAAFAAGKEPTPAAPKPGTSSAGSATPADAANHVVRVYYFRTTTRCTSCRKIEAFTDEAIKGAFAQEIQDGKMIWQVVNVEEPGNRRYIQDYKLAAKSVVVVDLVNGGQVRWKNLARIWELLNDETQFVQYVQREVREYLEGRS